MFGAAGRLSSLPVRLASLGLTIDVNRWASQTALCKPVYNSFHHLPSTPNYFWSICPLWGAAVGLTCLMVMGGNGPCPVALMVSPGKRFKFILSKWRLYIIFSEREKDVCEMVLWAF